MSKVFYHRVEITDGTGIIKDADGFSVSEVEVVAESEKQLVVAAKHGRFVVISKQKTRYDTCIGVETRDKVWGNRVSYHLYSYKRKRAASIRKAIEAEINRRFGFFISGIDMSCIDDGAKQTKKEAP